MIDKLTMSHLLRFMMENNSPREIVSSFMLVFSLLCSLKSLLEKFRR